MHGLYVRFEVRLRSKRPIAYHTEEWPIASLFPGVARHALILGAVLFARSSCHLLGVITELRCGPVRLHLRLRSPVIREKPREPHFVLHAEPACTARRHGEVHRPSASNLLQPVTVNLIGWQLKLFCSALPASLSSAAVGLGQVPRRKTPFLPPACASKAWEPRSASGCPSSRPLFSRSHHVALQRRCVRATLQSAQSSLGGSVIQFIAPLQL
mmetsp:Transcript_8342/g.25073  ORF Transcript_8342/g.25073 Transcript_8342/m.25073 type:complete len:213 (+) Transcript_8342:666-1304(+)